MSAESSGCGDVPLSQKAKILTCRFAKEYELSRLPEIQAIERRVLGCDYGGTSWTTRSEAVRISELLKLRPGTRLLDVGAGSGWPALYLARITGCDVVLADIPFAGLQMAAGRAVLERLAEQCAVVAADGGALPFNDGTFDKLSHSDVLCCMSEKLSMLRECRRVARAGVWMAFSVIAVAPSLSETERRIAIESGPPFVECPPGYDALLRDSGWRVIERIDVTTEFAQSLRTTLEELNARAGTLIKLLGPEQFTERVKLHQGRIAAVIDGLLTREIFVAQANPSEQQGSGRES